jgi:hypothetical protein
MRFPAALLLCGLLTVPALFAQIPEISGYVTKPLSGGDFYVSGIRVACGSETEIYLAGRFGSVGQGCPKKPLYLGEPAKVEGHYGKGYRSITATSITLTEASRRSASGSAVIDDLPDSNLAVSHAGSLLVRADGYRILITGTALIVWDAPLHSFADVRAGDWIHYVGQQGSDGTVVAEKVRLTPIVMRKSEEKYRKRSDFDPSNVPASAQQNILHEAFLGVDYKKIPPANDTALQARIDQIGKKPIPAFERDMPDTDPAKIDFRFQLTADPKWREVASLPSGVILIPREAAQRMQNDSQLAALLADGIAGTLERGPYRMRNAVRATAVTSYVMLNPAEAAGVVAGARAAARHKQEHQSDRVALGLMHDAGYDIEQAPVAWWLLGAKKPKPITEIPIPHRAVYLYRILGECWNNPQAAADKP